MAKLRPNTHNRSGLKKWEDPNFWEEVRFTTFGVFVFLFICGWILQLFD